MTKWRRENGARLNRLKDLTSMALDAELATLQSAQAQRQRTQDQIDALSLPLQPMLDESGVAGAVNMLRYQHWIDARRSELNLALARQTAACMNARDQAMGAFARKQGLEMVLARHQKHAPGKV